MAPGVVVGSVFFASNELFWMKQLLVMSRTNFVNNGRLQVSEHSASDELSELVLLKNVLNDSSRPLTDFPKAISTVVLATMTAERKQHALELETMRQKYEACMKRAEDLINEIELLKKELERREVEETLRTKKETEMEEKKLKNLILP